MAAPIPQLPPVTRATRPSSPGSIIAAHSSDGYTRAPIPMKTCIASSWPRLLRGLVIGLLLAAGTGAHAEALRVGTSGDYEPFSLREGPGYRGFDIDVARRFAADTDRSLEWVPFRWRGLTRSLLEKRFDVAMSGVTVRPERSVRGRFTIPVVENGAVLLVRDAVFTRLVGAGADPLDSLDSLDQDSVELAVNAGGHLERVTLERFQRARIRAIPDNASVRDALANGEVDAVVNDSLEAPHWLEGLDGVRVVGPFTRDRKAYWLPAGRAGLARELDEWLLARERDGTLAELRGRWFGNVEVSATASPFAAFLAATDERLALMPAVAEFKRASGAVVVDREREVRVIEAGWQAVEAAARKAGAPLPSRASVERLYRAQIDAAVDLQRRVLRRPAAVESFRLEDELRPALLRIGERMAWLLVQPMEAPSEPGAVREAVAVALARHGLPRPRTDAIADALLGVTVPLDSSP